ncbi:XisI protein [Desulfococcaceae bacterium HSG8]|nr:XisI protein [Desulfococcaceae bacterium HSG8]
MEKIKLYQEYVRDVIRRHSHHPAYGDIEVQQVFDTQNNHYQLVHAGWHKKEREYGCVIHMDIKDGKIWIQHDGTEVGVANELAGLGVPKQDIILAYHPPYKRQYSGFGVG